MLRAIAAGTKRLTKKKSSRTKLDPGVLLFLFAQQLVAIGVGVDKILVSLRVRRVITWFSPRGVR